MQVDAVLLSHLDVAHLGALPWLVGKQSLEAPVFGTLPIQRMGRLAITDHLQACQAGSDFQAFSSSDVAAAFDCMNIMHYQERAILTGMQHSQGCLHALCHFVASMFPHAFTAVMHYRRDLVIQKQVLLLAGLPHCLEMLMVTLHGAVGLQAKREDFRSCPLQLGTWWVAVSGKSLLPAARLLCMRLTSTTVRSTT